MHETLDELGFVGWPKTSGNRGIHVACRIEPNWGFREVRRCALAFAREVERRAPKLVTTAWWKEERGERVFIDYNQNARDRTIASAYSVRARPDATVSAPFRWDELDDLETEDFTLATMPARFAELGDVQAGIDDAVCDLRKLFEWVEREEARGRRRGAVPAELPEDAGRAEARPAVSRAKKSACAHASGPQPTGPRPRGRRAVRGGRTSRHVHCAAILVRAEAEQPRAVAEAVLLELVEAHLDDELRLAAPSPRARPCPSGSAR